MIINSKRAVAYFDILGFKSKIENSPIEKLATDYERIISQTSKEFSVENGQVTSREVCHRYIFSDSLFLIAKEDTIESFIDLISYAWRTMQFFIASGFPLRGAITYGEFYANLKCNVFLGKAISNAVVLEGQQNWIGAVVDQTAIDRYDVVFSGDSFQSIIMNTLFPVYNVPLKDGTYKDYHVINWRENMVSETGIKALFKNEPFDESVQVKIDNALRFSKAIVDAGTAYFDDELVPVRYRRIYIGQKEPPVNGPMFPNGDEY